MLDSSLSIQMLQVFILTISQSQSMSSTPFHSCTSVVVVKHDRRSSTHGTYQIQWRANTTTTLICRTSSGWHHYDWAKGFIPVLKFESLYVDWKQNALAIDRPTITRPHLSTESSRPRAWPTPKSDYPNLSTKRNPNAGKTYNIIWDHY